MVIAYLRVSTLHQNPENQREEIMRYTRKKELSINIWVTDTVSGKCDWKKRKLSKILKRMNSGDTLIVTEISRLSRSLHEIMTIMKYCIDNEIVVYSTKDGYTFDDSINSKVLSFAFGLAAEIEHKLISQRTKEALLMVRAQGKVLGRRKGSGEKMNTLIREKECILELINEGKALNDICDKFDVSYKTFYRFRDNDKDVAKALRKRKNM